VDDDSATKCISMDDTVRQGMYCIIHNRWKS